MASKRDAFKNTVDAHTSGGVTGGSPAAEGEKSFADMTQEEQTKHMLDTTIIKPLFEGQTFRSESIDDARKNRAKRENKARIAEGNAPVAEKESSLPNQGARLFGGDTALDAGSGPRSKREAVKLGQFVDSAAAQRKAEQEVEEAKRAADAGEGHGTRAMRDLVNQHFHHLMRVHAGLTSVLANAEGEHADAARQAHEAAGNTLARVADHLTELNKTHSASPECAGGLKDIHPILRAANNALNSKAIREVQYDADYPPGGIREVPAYGPGHITGIHPSSLNRMGEIIGKGPSDGFLSKNWTPKPWPNVAVGNEILKTNHPLFEDKQAFTDLIKTEVGAGGQRDAGKRLITRVKKANAGTPKGGIGGIAPGAAPTTKARKTRVVTRYGTDANTMGVTPGFEGKPIEPGDEGPGPNPPPSVDVSDVTGLPKPSAAKMKTIKKNYNRVVKGKARAAKRIKDMEDKAQREADNKQIRGR
jgi:hypothetical protein